MYEQPQPAPPCAGGLADRAQEFTRQSRARNTQRAYRADWADFTGWCSEQGREALPAEPETVALYLTARAETHRTATLARRLASINQAHQAAGHDSPTTAAAVRTVWKGIRRAKGTAQQGKAASSTAALRRMVATLPDTLVGRRDRAVLLVGFAGALRRSELVAIDVEDCEVVTSGLVVTLKRSKTDQEGKGCRLGIPYGAQEPTCPVRALQAWLQLAAVTSGPVFRSVSRHGRVSRTRLSPGAVALIVKRVARAAGLNADRFAGHSLRAGFVTSSLAGGAREQDVMRQTRHKSRAMLDRYYRQDDPFTDNAADAVGL